MGKECKLVSVDVNIG